MPLTVRAAGGVVVRPGPGGEVELAIVHRSAWGDWTLPKGKLA
jgi:8-oxo-dGTP pyrophosphatase MutT (NUDIX family)